MQANFVDILKTKNKRKFLADSPNSTMDIEVFLVVKELISAQNKIEIKKD